MLKNLIIYRIASGWLADLQVAEDALAKASFTECGATQEKSVGWVPPRGHANGAMVESIGGQWIARLMTEVKAIPGEVLAREVKAKAAQVEAETGRKPGKKETRELKEEAKLDLLPVAFTKQAATWVWIDPASRFLVLDTSSQSRADDIVTLLVEALPGLSVALLSTKTSSQTAMAQWLREHEPPTGFSIDRECELQSYGEEKAVVRYARHPLDIAEVQAHIEAGKLPTKLALTWDDRVSFVLTAGLQLRGVHFCDAVFDGQKSDSSDFDANVAIATGELSPLISDVIDVLDGLAEGGVQ